LHRLKSVITLLDKFAIFFANLSLDFDTCNFLPCAHVLDSFLHVEVLDVLLLSSVLDELVVLLLLLVDELEELLSD